MPSFSGFLRSPRGESSQFDNDRNATFSSVGNDSTEKGQRKQSKRDFFRSLLKRSSIDSGAKRRSGQFVKTSSNLESPKLPDTPTSPMSDPNKPLPPPPFAASTTPEVTTTRPVQNLQRIISPIATADLHKLFSGAPQFFARSEGLHTGAPHPSVAFPWDLEVAIRDLSDHVQIQNEAWSSVTAWPHATRDVQRNPDALKEHHEKRRAHFLPRCRERPNMLSMQGIERGTMGYAAALEMDVADALIESETNLTNDGPESLLERRKKFLNGKDGLRHLTNSTLLDLLTNVSATYHEDPLKHQRPTVELYTELFTQILYPPSRVTDSDDPYSIQVQIESLIEVLAADVWIDFSLVDWRIRLGQILWGAASESDAEDDITVNNEVVHASESQRFWLLLQILLSCELLLRLDTISMNYDRGLQGPSPSEIGRFEKIATVSVRWSHILARYWLENIQIVRPNLEASEKKAPAVPTAPAGWLASLTGAATASADDAATEDISLHNVQFHGRHQARQLNGLVHFARKLQWPNIEVLEAKISSNGITVATSSDSTPAIDTPLLNHRPSSYFPTRRPTIRRGVSRSQTMSALIHPSGWLSNSYINGLILPGEGLSHFLISTLLENDSVAVSRLGQEANLYGGFVYSNRSFWSTACIIGRILSAGKGATECIGWVSSDILPRGAGEAWLDIDVEHFSPTESSKDHKPRIWHKSTIEHDGNVIGGADSSSVLPGDFILPSEESTQTQALAIKLQSLDLFAAVDSVHTTPTKETATPFSGISEAPRIQTYSAMMRFSVDSDGEEPKEVNVELRHDVRFVTAYPCVSSHHTDLLKSPTSPSFQSSHQSPPGSPRDFTGHPLHKGFTYKKVSISALLSSSPNQTFESLLAPPQSPTSGGPVADPAHSSIHTTNSKIPKVLVVDCTDSTTLAFPTRPSPSPQAVEGKHKFGSDMEMLARALCAERGWNALVSRRGRGCLACSIREAGALGWRVLLRFA